MDTEITPTQLAIEYLRRDKSNLSPAQYLKKLKQLELEFTDLLALSSNELKEEIYFAWRLGVHSRPLSSEEKAASAAFFVSDIQYLAGSLLILISRPSSISMNPPVFRSARIRITPLRERWVLSLIYLSAVTLRR